VIESISLSWVLVVALTAAGVWFVGCGLRPGSDGARPSVADRISQLAHALMAAAMAVMIWPLS
jgi:hypothetical protein